MMNDLWGSLEPRHLLPLKTSACLPKGGFARWAITKSSAELFGTQSQRLALLWLQPLPCRLQTRPAYQPGRGAFHSPDESISCCTSPSEHKYERVNILHPLLGVASLEALVSILFVWFAIKSVLLHTCVFKQLLLPDLIWTPDFLIKIKLKSCKQKRSLSAVAFL